MNLEDFIEVFVAQFEETDPALIQKDTKFKELDEWSSLMALSLIAMIDEEYDIRIKGDDIRLINTVEDLFKLVESRR